MKHKSIFETDTNTKEQDGAPCAHCGGSIPALTKQQGHRIVADRSNRVDTDLSRGNQQSRLRTFHLDCWRKLVFGKC